MQGVELRNNRNTLRLEQNTFQNMKEVDDISHQMFRTKKNLLTIHSILQEDRRTALL